MSSAVVVPVPEAEPLVARWRSTWEPPAPPGVPAHITVLFPFLRPGRIDEKALRLLAEAAAGVAAFQFRLVGVAGFPQTIYLQPDPAAPFVELTRRVWERFPAQPPYGGHHKGLEPHLTVATSPDAETLDRAAAEAAAALPIEAHARAMHLMVEDGHGRYRIAAELPLGS